MTGSITSCGANYPIFDTASSTYSVKLIAGANYAHQDYYGEKYLSSLGTSDIYTVIDNKPTRYVSFTTWKQLQTHSSGSTYLKNIVHPNNNSCDYSFLIKTNCTAQVICASCLNTGVRTLLATVPSGSLSYIRLCHECYGGNTWTIRCWDVTNNSVSSSTSVTISCDFYVCYFNNISAVPTTYFAETKYDHAF